MKEQLPLKVIVSNVKAKQKRNNEKDSKKTNKGVDYAINTYNNIDTRIKELKVAREFLSILQRLGDTGAIVLGGYAMYQYQTTQLGIDEATAMNNVITKAETTQQGRTASNQSNIQQIPELKPVMVFTNALIQFNKKISNARKRFARGEITGKELAKTYFLYRVLMPTMYAAISSSFGGGFIGLFDDENDKDLEEYLRAAVAQIAMSPVKGMPLLHMFVPGLLQAGIEGRGYAPSIPVITDIWDSSVNRYSGDIDIKAEEVIAAMLEPLTGVPIGRITRNIKKIQE